MKYLKKLFNKIIHWFKKDSNKDLIDLIEDKIKEEIKKELDKVLNK